MKLIEHILAYAKAYASAATSAASLVLAYETHLSDWEKIALGLVAVVGSFAATAVLPSKAKGVTIGEAVTMDGEALAQATAVLKDVPLPDYAEKVVGDLSAVAGQAQNVGQMISPGSPPPAPAP